MRNYIGEGEVLEAVAPRALTSGEGAIVGSMFAVAVQALGNGETGQFFVGPGIVELPAVSANTAAVGAVAYWDNTAFNVTTTVGSNRIIGHFAKVKANGETTAQVRLDAIHR